MNLSVVIPAFNPDEGLRHSVNALLRQQLPEGHGTEILVVDDASTRIDAATVLGELCARVRVLRLPGNRGPGQARNAGASEARGKLLLFLDADCVPSAPDLLQRHLHAHDLGAELVFGSVRFPEEGFWPRYGRLAAERRQAAFTDGRAWVMTACNFSVRRQCFLELGGFDAVFARYGFEDRDLFLRMDGRGLRAVLVPEAGVDHVDPLSLASVCSRMHTSGLHSAGPFRQRHPAAYRALGYAHFDATLHPWLMVVDRLAAPLRHALPLAEWLLGAGWLPFALRRLFAKVLSALAFLHGTTASRRANRTRAGR